jgi:Ca2+-binding EF-hand superfamily protein
MLRMIFVVGITSLLAVAPSAIAAGQKKVAPAKPVDTVELAFKRFDANNDGLLSKAEFAELVAVQKLQNMAKIKDKKTGGLFSQLDTDKDGYLSLAEFKKISELQKTKKGIK